MSEVNRPPPGSGTMSCPECGLVVLLELDGVRRIYPHEEGCMLSLESLEEMSTTLRNEQMKDVIDWPTDQENVTRRWKAFGLDCVTFKHPMGHVNGYVRVPEGHPDANKHYDEVDVSVHGGLTFTCKAKDGGRWFGWDTAHYMDSWPGKHGIKMTMDLHSESEHWIHWTQKKVETETEALAKELYERSK